MNQAALFCAEQTMTEVQFLEKNMKYYLVMVRPKVVKSVAGWAI